MQEQDIQLAARCARLAEQSRHAATWLADNRETVGSECTTLQKEMRRAARFFGKCEQAARRKMCVGVFGPSQSGKSYLISALARDSRGDLLADFCGRTSDFITEINPEGGKESTGLVTRFTTTPPQGLTPDFPIRLRLLSEMDVVRVLANTYYADCEHKQMPDADAMRSALERLTQTARQSSPGASSVTADDVEDLREYLNRNFLSKPRVQMLQQGYWAQAVSLAPLLPLSYRAELFGIIWNNQPKFQQLFLELCQALEALGNPAEADCPLEALLPRQTSIIDVALLAGLGTNSAEDRLTLLGKDGRKAALPRAVVTALTAEITIF
ncbi:MAG: virulence factor SrfC family protein, partial [Desulfovibrio sp.]